VAKVTTPYYVCLHIYFDDFIRSKSEETTLLTTIWRPFGDHLATSSEKMPQNYLAAQH